MKSELAQRLLEICTKNVDLSDDPDGHWNNNQFNPKNLTEEQLQQVEEELIKHYEFERIVWMKLPADLDENGEPVIAKSRKITSPETDVKHTGQVGYVYSLVFLPMMYDYEALHTPVKGGCVLAPITYNPTSLLPKRSITIEWSPEFPQDIDKPQTWEDQKKVLHDKLEAVLENPEEYKPKGYRGCLIRYGLSKQYMGYKSISHE